MAGLINSAAPHDEAKELPEQEAQEAPAEQEAEPSEEHGEPAPAESGMTPESVRGKMTLPGNLKDAYERVVLAGMKVLFSKETHESALAVLQGEGPLEQRLADGMVTLMGTLVERSNKTLPPAVVIPAGIELLVAAGDYLKKSGDEPVDDQQIAEAMSMFIQKVLQESGTDPAAIDAAMNGQVGAQPQGLVNGAAPPPPPEGAPAEEEAM